MTRDEISAGDRATLPAGWLGGPSERRTWQFLRRPSRNRHRTRSTSGWKAHRQNSPAGTSDGSARRARCGAPRQRCGVAKYWRAWPGEGHGHGAAVHAYRGKSERASRVVGRAPAAERVHDQLAGTGVTKDSERELQGEHREIRADGVEPTASSSSVLRVSAGSHVPGVPLLVLGSSARLILRTEYFVEGFGHEIVRQVGLGPSQWSPEVYSLRKPFSTPTCDTSVIDPLQEVSSAAFKACMAFLS